MFTVIVLVLVKHLQTKSSYVVICTLIFGAARWILLVTQEWTRCKFFWPISKFRFGLVNDSFSLMNKLTKRWFPSRCFVKICLEVTTITSKQIEKLFLPLYAGQGRDKAWFLEAENDRLLWRLWCRQSCYILFILFHFSWLVCAIFEMTRRVPLYRYSVTYVDLSLVKFTIMNIWHDM